jgi:3-deoxy-D-manno-octulosonate 8-phosphate phosphatase KdsC-like HAD superfamily phosphatase
MKYLLVKASHIRLLIIDVDGALTNGSPELLSRIRGIIDSSNDGNG